MNTDTAVKMKILFVNAYFYPEIIAFSHLEKDIIEGLQNAGHDISVICPVPSRGVSNDIMEAYRCKKHEDYNGIHIRRYWAPQEGKNPIIRALRYFWCNYMGVRIGKKYSDIDVVFAVSTPPTQGLSVGRLAKKLKVPFIYSLQDVFPDTFVSTGLASKDSLVYKLGAMVERKTYPLCSKIIVISETIRQNLLGKGVSDSKLVTVSNWIDTDVVRPVPKDENKLFDEYDINRSKFNVVYAGNFGATQGAIVILQAAELLKDDKDIQFVIFGGGPDFEAACDYAKRHMLDNVVINPLLPANRISEVYSLGDIALITAREGVGKTGMPSKTWSIMACNTPIIAAIATDSELAEKIREAKAGVCIEPENPQILADAILNAHNTREYVSESFLSGREYVTHHASKHICVKKYVKCIENI